MVPEDVFELTGVADPRLSPDGKTVAYVVGAVDAQANDYRGAIWLAPADGAAEPRRFTSGVKHDADPRWSPDGAQLAFTSNREGKAMQLYVMPLAGGEPVQLTDGDCEDTGPAWSPDGARLAAQRYPGVLDDPNHTQIAVVDAAGGLIELLTTALDRNCGTYPQLRAPVWDGDDIVFALEDHGDTHLFRVAADGSRAPELVAGGERTVTRFDTVAGRLLRFPEESHELTRSGSPAHGVQRFQIVLEWFDRHLKG
jgi:dipeptidyl aminopeptidase/acylaminoacyl peptidase